MHELEMVLARLDVRHQYALRWFVIHSGEDVPWPEPLAARTLLATRAKGIYKPEWTEYALSVRQTLNGPYADRDPVLRSDGTWVFPYFQENADPGARDGEYTNRSLMACLRDNVPVGVMRQTSGKPHVRYKVLGLALVAGWEEGFSPQGFSRGHGGAAEAEALAEQVRAAGDGDSFDPSDVLDGRRRIMASIMQRQGQDEFRDTLLDAYGMRCALTGCTVTEVLEAAHIVPYRGPQTNHPTNGVLLRSDVHTLFDRGLLFIDTRTMTAAIAPQLHGSSYQELHGKALHLPKDPTQRPSREALDMHKRWAEAGVTEAPH